MNIEDQPLSRPNIFEFDDGLEFLKNYIPYFIKVYRKSFRQLGKELGFQSPNYLQKILNGQRKLTEKSLVNLAKGLDLNDDEQTFFNLLALDSNGSSVVKDQLSRMRKRASAHVSRDQSIFSSWLYGVVWELASAPAADASISGLCRSLKGVAKREEISDALNFLLKKGYLEKQGVDTYQQKDVVFKYKDDSRRHIDIQKTHVSFLKMAIHRINEDLAEREFQGLTIAVSKSKMGLVKERLRKVIAEIAEELADCPDAGEVLRIQCAAFWVTK